MNEINRIVELLTNETQTPILFENLIHLYTKNSLQQRDQEHTNMNVSILKLFQDISTRKKHIIAKISLLILCMISSIIRSKKAFLTTLLINALES